MHTNFRALLLGFAVLLATAGLAAQAAKPAQSKLLTSLQGTWVMTSQNGQDLAGSGQEILITIKDDTYTQTVNGQVSERGTFKIDETKKPMTLDISIKEGDNAGAAQVGVIQVNGNTMTGKLGQPGDTTARPSDFSFAEGFFVFTMVKR
jgi:uncharacterized protein (TIGR03067 family)